MTIKGMPEEAKNYEFIIVDKDYNYIGHTWNGAEAEETALAHNGLIIHDVRISGYRKPVDKPKYYLFNGTWSWGCWATCKSDAYNQLALTHVEEIDINTDDMKLEVYDNLS